MRAQPPGGAADQLTPSSPTGTRPVTTSPCLLATLRPAPLADLQGACPSLLGGPSPTAERGLKTSPQEAWLVGGPPQSWAPAKAFMGETNGEPPPWWTQQPPSPCSPGGAHVAVSPETTGWTLCVRDTHCDASSSASSWSAGPQRRLLPRCPHCAPQPAPWGGEEDGEPGDPPSRPH